MLPIFLYTIFLPAIWRIIPITAITALKVAVESSCARPLASPSRYERHNIHPVILVPMLAPMMIPIAWLTFIIPELTKPTTITVVADELWITAVTPVPRRIPFRGLLDNFHRIISSLLPATFLSPSPIRDIPNKNNATPPRSDMTICNPGIIRPP